jgi:predicted membrane protein
LLCLLLIMLHLVYYTLFPSDKGIMLSTLYVFFSLASRKNMMLLQFIRTSRPAIIALAVAAVVLAFVPHMLSVAITLALILETAYCFPAKVKDKKIAKAAKAESENPD